jgi:hypothetical protein
MDVSLAAQIKPKSFNIPAPWTSKIILTGRHEVGPLIYTAMAEYVSEEVVHLRQNLPLTQLHILHPHSGHTAKQEYQTSEHFYIYMLNCILTA